MPNLPVSAFSSGLAVQQFEALTTWLSAIKNFGEFSNCISAENRDKSHCLVSAYFVDMSLQPIVTALYVYLFVTYKTLEERHFFI